jgi:uncharacterized membrane protein
VAIFAASVLVGPLLGVYGQTYQTGADPWSLFAAWALLIAPWVIAARFTTLWVLAIALVDVALVLYWLQVRSPDSSGLGALPVVAAVHALAVCTWEWQRRRALPWLTESWAPRLLVAAGMGLLLVPATLLLAASRGSGGAGPLALVVLFSAAAAGLWYYQTVRSDPFMLTSVAGTGFVLITVLIGRLLILELHLGLAGPLLMAIVVIAEVTLSVAWLRRIVRGGAES